ncbi:hypothetical protein Tco_0095440, partial [Tanacetum coccineum]
RDQGYRIIVTGQQSADILERIRELEQDNRRLRDMMDVACQRVARTMPITQSRASRTREGVNEQINRQVAGALGAQMEIEEMEMEEMEMDELEIEGMELEGMETKEEMAITSEDLCLLESAHIKTS